MMNPFRIVWELIEFGIQALFVYILAIILIVGFVYYHQPKAVVSLQEKFDKIGNGKNKKEWDREKARVEYIKVAFPKVEKLQECTRIDGCRVLKDGTIEY